MFCCISTHVTCLLYSGQENEETHVIRLTWCAVYVFLWCRLVILYGPRPSRTTRIDSTQSSGYYCLGREDADCCNTLLDDCRQFLLNRMRLVRLLSASREDEDWSYVCLNIQMWNCERIWSSNLFFLMQPKIAFTLYLNSFLQNEYKGSVAHFTKL